MPSLVGLVPIACVGVFLTASVATHSSSEAMNQAENQRRGWRNRITHRQAPGGQALKVND